MDFLDNIKYISYFYIFNIKFSNVVDYKFYFLFGF